MSQTDTQKISKIIIIQGGPAVGKTTISRRLSKDLGVGLISKDSIKELFFETMGNPLTSEESALYGRASVDALYIAIRRFAEGGKTFIAENAYYASLAELEFHSIEKDTNAGILQIFCYCNDRKIHEKRFTERIESGERHKGHYDFGGTLKNHETINETYGPLDGINTISVDTTVFGDTEYSELLSKIKLFLTN